MNNRFKTMVWAVGFMAITISGCETKYVKPNIVFILADDLGHAQLGCFGSDYYQTPNLDQLANEGMRFTNAYAACAVCSPTRASIMTGKYPARLHLTDVLSGNYRTGFPLALTDWQKYLPLEEITVAEYLKEHGYRTEKPENHPVIAAMIERLDNSCGAIIDKISESGLEENTIFIFFSDNGGKHKYALQTPLRAGNGPAFESRSRIPRSSTSGLASTFKIIYGSKIPRSFAPRSFNYLTWKMILMNLLTCQTA